MMMLDATKGDIQRVLLEKELEDVGIRLNTRPPNIYFKIKKGGGVSFNAVVKLTHLNEKLVYMILHEYSMAPSFFSPASVFLLLSSCVSNPLVFSLFAEIFNAEVLIREDCTAGKDGVVSIQIPFLNMKPPGSCPTDEFIDVVVGQRKYMRCLYVYNKIDQVTIEEVDRLARLPNSVVVSCELDLNMDTLLKKIWETLNLTRIHTKRKGERPDTVGGIIMRNSPTVEHVVRQTSETGCFVNSFSLLFLCAS